MLQLTALPSELGKGGVGLGDDEPSLRKFLQEHANALVAHDAQLLTSTGGTPTMVWVSPEIDLMAAPAVYQLVPAGVKKRAVLLSAAWVATQKSGTISTSPTFRLGTGVTNDEYAVTQTASGFITQAVNTRITFSSTVSPVPIADLEPLGMKIEITVAATGSSSPVLKGRAYVVIFLLPQ